MKKKGRVKAGNGKSATAVRQKAFAEAYIANGRNALQAAIAAGYSAKTAGPAGTRLLKHVNVSALVNELSVKAEAISGLSAERTLTEVARLAYSDVRKLYRPDGSLKPPDEWDDDTAAAVGGLEVTEEFTGVGEARVFSGFNKKVKLWDKGAALEKAMKHFGLYERDNAQTGKPVLIKMVFE